MKRSRIIQIIVLVIVATITFIGFGIYAKLVKHRKARDIADDVIVNLVEEDIYDRFLEEYFQREDLYPILEGFRRSCDWKARDGQFVNDVMRSNVGGTDVSVFLYEYYLNCDSLRFIITVNMEEEPILMGLDIQPIETENPLVIRPDRQLKNRE